MTLTVEAEFRYKFKKKNKQKTYMGNGHGAMLMNNRHVVVLSVILSYNQGNIIEIINFRNGFERGNIILIMI